MYQTLLVSVFPIIILYYVTNKAAYIQTQYTNVKFETPNYGTINTVVYRPSYKASK